MDGPESFAPGEGQPSGNEQISEEKRQAFAGATQAIQQIRKEEKKAKKRDDGVAQVILQFLTDDQRIHLATLISRLVAINCPSHFILAILSLISAPCAQAVDDYINEQKPEVFTPLTDTALMPLEHQLSADATRAMADWMSRIDAVLDVDAPAILRAIVIEENNIDGTILQLTTFVLQEFLTSHGKESEFEKLQHVAVGLLQSVLTDHMQAHMERRLAEAPAKGEDE